MREVPALNGVFLTGLLEKVPGNGLGGHAPAWRERRPVIEIDERDASVRRDDRIASVDPDADQSGGQFREPPERTFIEGMAGVRSRIKVPEKVAAEHAVELHLVAPPMLLQDDLKETAPTKVGQCVVDVSPLVEAHDVVRAGGVDIMTLGPDRPVMK